MKKIILLLMVLFSSVIYAQENVKIALTPPMGWNSWNKFGCDVDENMIKEMADAMVNSGMKDAGYEYIVIDDCWQVSRDSLGNIIADTERFPSGIKALADYVHSKGLKFGIYSDAGMKTCQGRPGSRGYEYQDARTYAGWGVDYLKYDWCNHSTQNAKASYSLMKNAIVKSGRPIVFSICEWGTNKPWLWGKEAGGNLWRTTGDILNCWDCTTDWGGMGWIKILDLQNGLESYAGPGHWNDPDMLEVGNGGLNDTECIAHFSLWCMLAAPLMAGNDLRDMSESITEILTNKEVIAIDQDVLGKQGYKIRDDGDFEVWYKPMESENIAICFLNRSTNAKEINIDWNSLDIKNNYKIRDLWKKKDVGTTNEKFSGTIEPHGVILLKLTN
ncbi:MAG: glycoside hydrolase family 27 protein [Bacteroidales bacterium]|nr:glycoside hydrolase family 27 protein [Bacteroidales bacterium]